MIRFTDGLPLGSAQPADGTTLLRSIQRCFHETTRLIELAELHDPPTVCKALDRLSMTLCRRLLRKSVTLFELGDMTAIDAFCFDRIAVSRGGTLAEPTIASWR